jgi:hypothetical protein
MNFRFYLLIAAVIVLAAGLGVWFVANRTMKRACAHWADLIHENLHDSSVGRLKRENAELFQMIMEQLSDFDEEERREALAKVSTNQASDLLSELDKFKFARRNA